MHHLADSTYGMYERFKWMMHVKNNVLKVWTILLTRCSCHMCICLFCNQTRRFIYRSGACFGAMLFTISTNYNQISQNDELPHGTRVYGRKKPCIVHIHGKTIQWETRKKILQYYNKKYSHVICISFYRANISLSTFLKTDFKYILRCIYNIALLD